MRRILKAVFGAMFLSMLVACATSSTSSIGYTSCQPSTVDASCTFGG
jgi:hypothetical protein